MSLELMMRAVMSETQYLPATDLPLGTEKLKEVEREEVLAFLSERPVQNVCLAGFIRDNGLISEHNRGDFYGCRNSEGRLEGVALIGHATLVDARTRGASRELALTAQGCTGMHMILGERSGVEEFWNYYADEGQEMRRACRETLLELRRPMELTEEIADLRPATLDDLDLIAPAQAAMAEAESGINPLEHDPEGFRARCARRIGQGRVWVIVRDGELLFKADVQADTPEVIYLEGVWVAPPHRGTGLGRKCLRQLCVQLLAKTRSICVLVNQENGRAHTFYRMCNFKAKATYDSVFLRQG